MNRPLQLLKDYRVGIWCRRAAWIILAIGLIRTALTIYSNLLSYGSFPGSVPMPSQLIIIVEDLTTIVDVLFYFFILYAAAVAIEHMTGSTREEDLEVEDLDEEDLEMEDLDEKVLERLKKR